MSVQNAFIGRRNLLKRTPIAILGLAANNLFWHVKQAEAAEAIATSLTLDDALQKLMEGNQRFVQHQP
ncbi:MAG: carbonic anhydrase, partial [Leptolyngbyaceae cyanobacterium SM1_4_3]|nr:carbonic anhydrase [Leptolyngbyaceae cyanobacterium SM1_4_3]